MNYKNGKWLAELYKIINSFHLPLWKEKSLAQAGNAQAIIPINICFYSLKLEISDFTVNLQNKIYSENMLKLALIRL